MMFIICSVIVVLAALVFIIWGLARYVRSLTNMIM